MDLLTILLLLVITILIKMLLKGRKPKGMPPGPRTWPFLGNLNLLFHRDDIHVITAELGKKYDGMFSEYINCNFTYFMITVFFGSVTGGVQLLK